MCRASLCFCLCLAFLLPSLGWAGDKSTPPTEETAAEQLRKALDQVRDLEIHDQPLDAAVNHLREQTGINFVIDRAAVPPTPLAANLPGAGVNPSPPASYAHLRIQGQFHGQPLRAALMKLLRKHDLTHVLVGDTVLITTSSKAADRQLGQTVSVNVPTEPFRDELKRLARQTGANLVLDPRMSKEGQTRVTLRLDEVPLDTAVELLADQAGLRAVRLNNVLYVTSEERAAKLRKPPAAASVPGWRIYPDGQGGFRLSPPSAPAGGGGIGGIAGLGGIGGIAGLGGIGGFQGNFQGGGFVGGVAPPVPLTPPLPRAKPAPPQKPAKQAPPAKPAVKDAPPAKDKPQAQGVLPDTPSPRTRRSRRS
jgi:hypothetical protein